MRHFSHGTRWSRLLHLSGALVLATACSRIDEAVMPPPPPLAVDLAMDISSATAAPGDQVALVFTPTGLPDMGGFQGYLTYDPSRLDYVGQETTNGSILMVNRNNAPQGELRLAALNTQGLLPHVGTLVFRVLRAGYAESFRFKVEEAATNGVVRVIDNVSVLPIVRVDRSLRVPSDAQHMTGPDWVKRVEPNELGQHHTALTPGQIVPGLRFGDANLSLGATPITLSDVLVVINVSVGLQELIVGTNSPAVDAVVASNVFPANGTDLGEPTDILPPGYNTATDPGDITLSDALAIINESVGLDQAVVGELIPGRPAVPASNRVVINANVTTSQTWTKNNIYELQGSIQVTGGATLTIEAGTLIEGTRGTGGAPGSALFVQRDGMIQAVGTAYEPIVFTCVGTGKYKGCWGGVVINGNAGLNEGTLTSPIIAGRATTGGCFEKTGEGASGLYGGCNDADNSGRISYVRVEYGGFRINAVNELNGMAFQGVGSATTLDHIQAHAGLDDGFEFFGGTVNAKYLVATANQDDNIDWVEGFRGKLQYIIIQQDSLDGDKGFEADNTNTQFDVLPRALPTIWNATIIGKADPAGTGGVDPNNNVEGGMHIRRGTRPNIGNILQQGAPWGLRVDDNATCGNDATGGPFQIRNSIFTQNSSPISSSSTATCATNFLTTAPSTGNQFPATSPLLAPYNVLTPDFRPAFGTGGGGLAPPNDGWFDQAGAAFIGAVAPANASKSNIPWYAGWTRAWQSATVP